MSKTECVKCRGRGLKADNSGECDGCDGFGILIVEDQFRLLPGGVERMETTIEGSMPAVSTPAPVKPVEYRPQRQVESVRKETLQVWKEELEVEERKILKKLDELRGAIAQIDVEFARRLEAKKKA